MTNIFNYISLAMEIVAAVNQFLHLSITATSPLTGPEIAAIVQPVVSTLQAVVPKAVVPPALVLDICDAVADAVAAFKPATVTK